MGLNSPLNQPHRACCGFRRDISHIAVGNLRATTFSRDFKHNEDEPPAKPWKGFCLARKNICHRQRRNPPPPLP
jgi:hypothetical protein